jgi:predicted nucleic acid-binding protein
VSRDYLLDTNHLSIFAMMKSGGSDPRCDLMAKRLKDRQDARILLCPVPVGEIHRGLRIAPNASILKDINEAAASFHGFLPIDQTVALECYAELWSRLFKLYASKSKKAGKPEKIRMRELLDPTFTYAMQVEENDLWLAAVAMCHNLVLVTHDKMDRLKSISAGDLTFDDWLVS